MYLTHYNLRIKPFETSPDPKFLWLSEKHKEALASLKYGIQENKGFLLLTGDIGTGKTTLINCLLNENGTDAIIASIPDPELSIADFFKLLSKEFNLPIDFDTKADFLIQFENFLHNTYSEEKKALLIIDEAQRLNQQLLEQIRLLSNIERQDVKLINIFFVGQNELYELILDEQNKALRQRITVHYSIEPLTESETRDYIKHRLRLAGSEEEIFSPEAIYEIFSFSKGYPRLINTICDRALLTVYVLGLKKIDGKIAKKCADELIIPGERDDTRNADREELEVNVNEKTPFAWRRAYEMLRRWKNKHANCELTDESIEKALTPQAARHAIQYKGKWYKGPTYLYRDLGDIVEIPFARFHAKLTKWKKENPNCKPKDEDINSFFKRTRVQVDDDRFIGPLRLMWEELPEPKIQWDFVRQKVPAFRNEFGREPTKEEIKEISTPEEWMNRLDDPNLLGSNNRVLKKAPNVIKITSREITIAGETFSSLTKAAKHYDINRETFCYRIRHGWTPEEAAELVNKKADNRPKEISIGGKTFPSGSAAAKYYGITPSNFNTRLRRGWTPEQAAGIEPPPKKA